MRLIDAEQLCKDLMKRWTTADKDKEKLISEVMAEIVTPIVVAQPTVNQWTPCHERLPDDGRYLVDCKLSVFSPQIMNYSDGEWFYDGCKSMDLEIPAIKAWMPLPEPWKGGEKKEMSE